MRIRSLLLLLALGVAVPALAFAVVVSAILLDEQRQAVERGAIYRARAMMSAVDATLRGQAEAARTLASTQALRLDDLSRFRKEAELALKTQPAWTNVSVAAPDGAPLLVIGPSLPSGEALEDVEGSLRAAGQSRPVIGDVLQPEGLAIPVWVPVFRDGVLKYVVTVAFRPSVFDVVIQAQGLPTGWTSGIVDGRGNFVARVPYQPAGKPASQAFRDATKNGTEGWYRGLTVENRDSFTAYRRSDQTNWTIGLAVPADLILATTWKTAWLLAISAALAFAIALALTFLTGRRISRPMESLAKLAGSIGATGPKTIPRSGVKEIENVATALVDSDAKVSKLASMQEAAVASAQAAAETNAKFKAFFHGGSYFAGLLALDGTVVEANRASLDAGGFTRDDVIGKKFWEGGWWKGSPRLIEMSRVGILEAAAGNLFRRETAYFRSDGASGVMDLTLAPVSGENGKPLFIAATATDITDRKRAEEDLRTLNADLERKIIERTQARGRTWQVSPDLLGALNSKGYFETSNPAWNSVLGWSEEEVASMSIFELLHPDDVERTRAGFELTQLGKPAIQFPNRYRCKDGTYRWISWVGVPEDGYVYCIGRDITAEKLAQAELAETHDALRQSQKMEAVGQLTGGIAHDFNNLLAIILGSLELLQLRNAMGRLDDNQKFIDAAQKAATRAAALTRRLLAFSRKQPLRPAPVRINRLVADMTELIRNSVGTNVRVKLALDDDDWPTLVDAGQLENSLLNLCINARDAMPDGGSLTITTGSHTFDERAASQFGLAAGDYVSARVMDDGLGMPPEVVARAFEPFFTTKRSGQGSGLGLSMVYGFVKQSGGHVDLASEVGAGTSICLYLPRYLGAVDEANATTSRSSEVLPSSAMKGQTILVVDDEDLIRMLIIESLKDWGYAALSAVDGESAIEILRSEDPVDLLITDVGLPGGIGGRQIADAARKLRPGIKVLFITALADKLLEDADAAGVDTQVLAKPFSIEMLAQKLRQILLL
jgi:PAS domain S-box-containing protein